MHVSNSDLSFKASGFIRGNDGVQPNVNAVRRRMDREEIELGLEEGEEKGGPVWEGEEEMWELYGMDIAYDGWDIHVLYRKHQEYVAKHRVN